MIVTVIVSSYVTDMWQFDYDITLTLTLTLDLRIKKRKIKRKLNKKARVQALYIWHFVQISHVMFERSNNNLETYLINL